MQTGPATPLPFLADLTVAQRDAACQDGPVLVLAGAGTGKTKTLTAAIARRIASGVTPSRILAVTFTNKAARGMTERIAAVLGEGAQPGWVGTFHGLGARQLRIEPEAAHLRPGFDIMDADDSRRLLKRVMKSMQIDAAIDEGIATSRDPVKLMAKRIETFKDNLIAPEDAALRVEGLIGAATRERRPIDAAGFRAAVPVYIEYQRRLREANAADFGDLLLWPARTMQIDEAYRLRWAGRFDCVLADEYQDVCYVQYAWLRLLSADHHQIFAVGDDDQAIYSWRGSDLVYLRRFLKEYPDGTLIRLEENFRSTAHILDAANGVIAHDAERMGKTLFTRKPAGDPIEILRFADAGAEANGIADEIQRRHGEGIGWDDMAILYRSNFLSRGFEEAMMRRRIPYVLVGDVGFYQRAEVKDALAFLRIATTPDDVQSDEAFRRVINTPPRGFGPKALDELEAEASFRQSSLFRAIETADLPTKCRSAGLHFIDLIRAAGRDTQASVADQISTLLDQTGYRAMLRASRAETTEDRLENLQELLEIAAGFHTARDLLDHAALATSGPGEDRVDRVKMMTLHKAKGLEFPHVFLPGWEAGAFPPPYGDVAEERRLAYVALTRGMRRVTVSHCEYRRGYEAPSLYVDDIPHGHKVSGWLRANARVKSMGSGQAKTIVSWPTDAELVGRMGG
ncbi:ATP-dependent helicase [Acidiphilium sp.]|uniref:ATP-dependent helicase n=1 Tax=Acidiphilium sp. TaxID=527 RepID=UPI00258C037F|nr:UvrD-helicase domain-containing protein [Acidiphilium sp.]